MKTKTLAVFALTILALATAQAATYNSHNTFYNTNGEQLNNIQALLYSCENDESCSTITDSDIIWQGSSSTNQITLPYPATPTIKRYAEYFFIQGYLPKEVRTYSWGTGNINSDVIMEKAQNCKAPIQISSGNIEATKGQTIQIQAEIEAPLTNSQTPIKHFPNNFKQFYSSDISIILTIDNQLNSIQKENLLMDTIHKTNFDIDTSNLQTGTHEIKLQTNILDTKCESSILQQDSVQLLIKEPFQDTTPPQITILTPQQTILNTNTINFAFIVTDQSPIQSCSLLINGITEQTSTNIQTPHTFTQFLSDGNYAFQIECTDSAANTAQTPPITITVDTQPQIQNTPPTLSSLDLTQNPTTASILECIASPQDTEQSSVRVIFTWYKNGLFHLLENIACTAGQNCDSQIPSQETQKQDTWTCIAQAYDSLLYSQALQAITKILNSNPTSQAIPNIQFQQGQSATLDLNNYFSDPDNDPLTFTAASNELTITINNGIATFTSPNWCGQTQITFTASDNSQSIQEQATAIVACSPTPPIPPTPEPEDKHKKEIQKIKIAQAIIKDNQLFIKTSSNKETQAQLTIISETNLIKKDIQLNRATEWYIFPFTENYAIIKLKSNSQEIKTFTTA